MRWCIVCHREAYWEKTASSEFESKPEDEPNDRGWWGVRAEDRGRGLVEDDPDDEREEDPVPADD